MAKPSGISGSDTKTRKGKRTRQAIIGGEPVGGSMNLASLYASLDAMNVTLIIGGSGKLITTFQVKDMSPQPVCLSELASPHYETNINPRLSYVLIALPPINSASGAYEVKKPKE